ncbi:MAG TPA: hypothetical protein VG845_10575 [Dehalococcoidia bacterium]|nr:hypothetical protein [Dehalococcoidia bacterium]
MKLLFPGAGLISGFLLGHGSELPVDLLILMGTIVLAYAGVAAIEFRRHVPSSSASLRRSAPTSHHA